MFFSIDSNLMKAKPKVGLVLGGGIARGLAHIGVLKVLDRENIPIHSITGVSIGAFIGALYATGVNLKDIEYFGTTTSLSHFYNLSDFICPRLGLVSGGTLVERFNSYVGNKKIEELKIKLAIQVIDIKTGKKITLKKGPVKDAVRAGIAMPFFFKAVPCGSKLLVDGGFANPLPVDVARENADIIIAVKIRKSYDFHERKIMRSILNCSYTLMRNELEDLKTNMYKADVTIEPAVSHFKGDDVSKASAIIAAGEKATEKKIGEIKRLLKSKGLL